MFVYECGQKTNYPRKLHLVTRSQRLFSINYHIKMADKSNDGSNKPRRSKKERVWTETELKNLALVLADEKKQYAVRLETASVSKLKVPITPKIFLGRNKSLYRTEQDSANFFFIWLKPRFFVNFQSYFFPARPSEAKTGVSDIIPGFSGHLHQLVVV